MNRILVIEDDTVINETICDILEVKGYEVSSALNGYDGLNIFNNEQIDLVICDINMPLMDGYDTIKKFKESSKNLLIPFLFISALASTENVRTGMNLGADDYLTKPFRHKDLCNAVDRLLHKYDRFKSGFQKMQDENVNKAILQLKKDTKSKQKDHLDSLEHAKMVQGSILPERDELNDLFGSYGLFHAPKDIVSGDFYWAREIEGKKLIAVGDCTGHGVPAALLTMVYSGMLSIAVDKFGMKGPGEILDKTNELVTEFMNSNNSMLNNDMDIILCSIDPVENQLHFAGAKRPLFFISNELDMQSESTAKINTYTLGNQYLYKIKGTVKSVGSTITSNTFQEHTITFRENDLIYLSSDGFCDQFGGLKGKKYNIKRFIKLLLQLKDKTPSIQEDELKSAFLNWKGNIDQTDDVTVFLMKLSA